MQRTVTNALANLANQAGRIRQLHSSIRLLSTTAETASATEAVATEAKKWSFAKQVGAGE